MIIKTVTIIEPPFAGTRLRININNAGQAFGIFSASLASGRKAVSVDWGDGTIETRTSIGQTDHTYAKAGDYEIRISDDVYLLRVCSITEGTPYSAEYPQRIRHVYSNARQWTRIPGGGFANSVNLLTVDLAETGLTSVMAQTFSNCRTLLDCRLPKDLKTIGVSGFKGCIRLPKIDLPLGVATLSASVFQNCAALSGDLSFPSVQAINGSGTDAPFLGCAGIDAFHFSKANEASIRASSGYKADPTLGTGRAECFFDL